MKYLEIPIRTEESLEYARLETYILDTPAEKIRIKKRPMILICPGGGYEKLSYREGEPLAVHFLSKGYHACVLRYSVAPVRYPVPLLELGEAMKTIHQHAEEWSVDRELIFLHGASAGGHLAGMLGAFWNQEWLAERLGTFADHLKPAGLLLSYPVITAREGEGHLPSFRNLLGENWESERMKYSLELLVNKDTPPAFLWHTGTDATVPVINSIRYTMAMQEKGIPAELHIFPEGEHGLSLASPLVERFDGSGVQECCQSWIDLADEWIQRICKKISKKNDLKENENE